MSVINKSNGFSFILRLIFSGILLCSFTESIHAYMSMTCPPASWNGFYIGGELGKAWNDTDWTYKNANYYNTLGPRLLGTNFTLDANGLIGGGYVGFNYQTDYLVLGVEGSALATDLNASGQSPFFSSDRYTAKMGWVAIFKGRVGIAFNQWLLSLSGGWAGSDVNLTLDDQGAHIRAHSSQWSNGWIAGAGLDYKFTNHVSLGIAYDYIRLTINNKTLACPLCGSGVGFGAPIVDGNIKPQMLTARLSYFF